MEHLSERKMTKICKLLMKQNEEEEKLKKYKVANENVKKYNEIAQLKIKGKKINKKLDEIKEKMKMFETIKTVEVSANDEEYELKYDCEGDEDEDGKDKRVERFRCDFEECKQSYKRKEKLSQHFTSHFTGELTCKQCNATFTSKESLKRHLLIHENKRQFKCPHEGCDKTFNTRDGFNSHKTVHSENKLFKCTFDGCDYVTNIHGYERRYLKAHIKRVHLKKK